jgi:hypothetical protein
LFPAIGAGLGAVDFSNRDQVQRLQRQLDEAHRDALEALYRDMGIPPMPIGQWVRQHIWQRLRVRVWDHLRQYWCERWRPQLQGWWTRGRGRGHGAGD